MANKEEIERLLGILWDDFQKFTPEEQNKILDELEEKRIKRQKLLDLANRLKSI